MQSYGLHPPNCQTFSDEVIGSVIQRLKPVHRSSIAGAGHSVTIPRRNGILETNLTTRGSKAPHSRSSTKLVRRKNKRPPPPSKAVQHTLPENEEDSESDGEMLQKLRETDYEAYHRERRRRNQERYRKRQKQMTEDLEADNQQLRGEIEQLQLRRNAFAYGVSTKETIWSVAAEYCRIFCRGLPMPEEKNSIVELDFLRATMAPDLDAGTVVGLEAVARNWRVFTEFFQDVQIQLDRLDQIVENSIVATTTLRVTISRLSLHNMFPHLIIGKHKKLSPIAEKLLGQRLVMHGSVRFDWDDVNNRVVSLISQGDMISPLLKVLGRLEDVSHVFNGALVSPDCNLVIGGHLNQYTICY